jgi:predicted O-methyltransferase YrrM
MSKSPIRNVIQSMLRSVGYKIVRIDPTGTVSQTNGEPRITATEGGTEPSPPPIHDQDKASLLSGPYMLAPNTYNPDHPDYDIHLARNYAGAVHNVASPTKRTETSLGNPFFQKIYSQKLMTVCGPNPADPDFLRPTIEACARQLEGDSDYAEFEGKYQELDDFIKYLNATFPGEYYSGGVNIEDGLFLYYAVRMVKPDSIIQTGVSNGVSSSFMVLALKHNGEGGKLHAIDRPVIYEPNNPAFHEKKAYPEMVPHGKNSGWLVPQGLRRYFECQIGDSTVLLPELVKRRGTVDMFYHDSDHSYSHMWFEFETVTPHIRPHGIIVADNTAWSSVTWDFAASIGCYSFNHRGSQGLIFL